MRSGGSCKMVPELHDLFECLPTDAAIHPPGCERIAFREDLFNLFERASSRLWKHEENVDECAKVERAEDKIGFVSDVGETGWDGPCKGKVEQPVRCRRQRDCLCADTHWKDLSRIGPRNGTHGNSEAKEP
jgi:hypothetical protein